ncbi:hypothetical protein AKJ09_10283 [Labilithrix luteola]|uniref:Cytochrome c-552/4 domain-containing protein n=1 Tax=Labilithrix luteola TaxID=1391654 RepID=A0A0K1QDV9_9BACT|nr:multiheme c-type cytochrome [Labilithrix luteola]AKV03620.1 hypothetical protein AKJ09_10283 [Labilithrix luteola]
MNSRFATLGVLVTVAACDARPSVVSSANQANSTNTSCENCHRDIAEEWRGSFHRMAFTDDTFQRSLALEEPSERTFCVQCHAPEKLVANGVGCISCHGEAAPRSTVTARAPHALTKDASFGTSQACASCHQFTFDAEHDGRPDLVQKTLDEHAASPFADVSCAACHMPPRRGHRDHSFAGGHALDLLRHSVRIEARRLDRDLVHVVVESSAGHAFPTGDMFRRARLLVFGESADGSIVASSERSFGRTWGVEAKGPQAGRRRELTDTRLRGRFEDDVRLEGSAPITRVRYALLFERILSMRGEADVSPVSSDVIAEGLASE